jgi:hypothetical protein
MGCLEERCSDPDETRWTAQRGSGRQQCDVVGSGAMCGLIPIGRSCPTPVPRAPHGTIGCVPLFPLCPQHRHQSGSKRSSQHALWRHITHTLSTRNEHVAQKANTYHIHSDCATRSISNELERLIVLVSEHLGGALASNSGSRITVSNLSLSSYTQPTHKWELNSPTVNRHGRGF